ncbi:MAG: DUF1800 domain-containing protein [Verrucomicrobiota bacterium]|nr:DUF1800 domain-containing protein [Verrucomicrobiota bacterium]
MPEFSSAKWNDRYAAHLLNRAGFGAIPQEVAAARKAGLEATADRLLSFPLIPVDYKIPEWAKPDPERFKKLREYKNASPEERQAMQKLERQHQRDQLIELRQWWLELMRTSPFPLQEKLALFWHGHFATSIQKVKSAFLMWQQNDIFRKKGAGRWIELLTAVSKDPAMLIWLDQAQSKKDHPNENFAREVMELFTLGEGNYSEKDVTEAARALTGWSLERGTQQFVNRANWHDPNSKTILGETGNWKGEDVLEIILKKPQSNTFICAKLWEFFAGTPPEKETLQNLAHQFSQAGQEFRPLLKAIFRAEEFYADKNLNNQVKSPVQWLVGTVRLLDRELPSSQVSTQMLRTLGQDLFQPPNVKGWDGGLSWINTNHLLNRYNFSAALIFGEKNVMTNKEKRTRPRKVQGPVRVESLFQEEEIKSVDKLLAALDFRFTYGTLKPRQKMTLKEYLAAQKELESEDILNGIRLIMSTPDYQLI